MQQYFDTFDKDQLNLNLGSHGGYILKDQMQHFHDLDNNKKIKLLQCMKNVKDNKLTNDDLVCINLWYCTNPQEAISDPTNYFIPGLDSLKLTMNEQGTALEQAFRDYIVSYKNRTTETVMQKGDIESFIKNIGKQRIDDPEEKKNFAKAVWFLLNSQTKDLQSKYDSNDYNTIDSVTTQHKENWKNFIRKLNSKNLIKNERSRQLTSEIDNACDLNTFAAVGEWILALIGSIITIGILP